MSPVAAAVEEAEAEQHCKLFNRCNPHTYRLFGGGGRQAANKEKRASRERSRQPVKIEKRSLE